jgi:hypothetical protein
VLVAGAPDEVSALYLAANGCQVTTLAAGVDTAERVVQAAIGAGLSGRVHAQVGDLSSFAPDTPLNAVIVNPEAFAMLSPMERARVIDVLQSATLDGGVHLVQTLAGIDSTADTLSLDELRARYRGWQVTVERGEGEQRAGTFLARKGAA